MDPINTLSNHREPVKTSHLNEPVLDSGPLLGLDVWGEASVSLETSVETATNSGLVLEQQQYLSDHAIDRHLHATLEHEFVLLDRWLRNNCEHSESAKVASFLQRRKQFLPLSWVEGQERLYLWASKHEADDLACSILGWRLLCRELAESLIEWASGTEDDLRGRMIMRLWHGSPGYYPQNRLGTWALRFLEDSRAPQVLAWEGAINRQILEAHPQLLTREQ
ncbi:MAG TPA: hypothetical protein VE860_23070 [Chthoniobacterales bacterium]|jgi:hypothetical protein|nr:hypothetical protein [Chthoniobacterales bacterium]